MIRYFKRPTKVLTRHSLRYYTTQNQRIHMYARTKYLMIDRYFGNPVSKSNPYDHNRILYRSTVVNTVNSFQPFLKVMVRGNHGLIYSTRRHVKWGLGCGQFHNSLIQPHFHHHSNFSNLYLSLLRLFYKFSNVFSMQFSKAFPFSMKLVEFYVENEHIYDRKI